MAAPGVFDIDTQKIDLNRQYIRSTEPPSASKLPAFGEASGGVNDVGLVLDDFEAIERKYGAQKPQKVVTDGYYGSANVPIADI